MLLSTSSSTSSDGLGTGFQTPLSRSLSTASSFASTSLKSLELDDDPENATITPSPSKLLKNGRRKSQEDLEFLATSTHITELSYNVSDIQARIFEIQELRHKSQGSSDASGANNEIDQLLVNLDERLDLVSKGVKAVTDALEPLLNKTPVPPGFGVDGEAVVIMRKHAALVAEWEAAKAESGTLRDELKEDKWLIVFRTVTEQAGGLMSSLEKGVNRCQDFITQVHLRDDQRRSSIRSDKSPPTLDSYLALLQSYEAKKKHYVPAITKVLSVLDKGAQDRVTKNGECLRRHSESTQRWRNLRERIQRTDDDMEEVRRMLQGEEQTPSESGSALSATTSGSRGGKSTKRAEKTKSPFRKLAQKIKGSPKQLASLPITPAISKITREPSSEPTRTLRARSSLLFRGKSEEPSTPERPGHKHTQSLTPGRSTPGATDTLRSKPKWNASTRVAPDESLSTPRHPSSGPSSQETSPHRRSASRASMSSSRPWSPITQSSIPSITQSSIFTRPPSRIRSSSRTGYVPQPPIRPPSRSHPNTPATMKITPPRARPKTPSNIPAPSIQWRSFSDENGRALSPTSSTSFNAFSISGRETPGDSLVPHPRPPSRSMIPIPSLKFSSPSRSASVMSNYSDFDSPYNPFLHETTIKARLSNQSSYQDARKTPKPTMYTLPPSSFRDGMSPRPSMTHSRPGSRAGAHTPGVNGQNPHTYIPASSKDPLDLEVARVVNSIPHAFLIERVDPPLRTAPREGDEVRAQYAVSSSLSRKVITCKLTTLTRLSARGSGQEPTTTKKVMCRVGGGWQDLQVYIQNHQAGT